MYVQSLVKKGNDGLVRSYFFEQATGIESTIYTRTLEEKTENYMHLLKSNACQGSRYMKAMIDVNEQNNTRSFTAMLGVGTEYARPVRAQKRHPSKPIQPNLCSTILRSQRIISLPRVNCYKQVWVSPYKNFVAGPSDPLFFRRQHP